MNPTTRHRLAGGGLVLAVAAGLLGGIRACGRPVPRPQPLNRELRDLGTACLALGEVQPPLAEISDADLEAMVEILGRLIAAYQYGDFDSFLALRAGDLEYSNQARAGELDELRGFCRELGVRDESLRGDWVDVLGRYWTAYYARPPVARFLPETTRVELHLEGLRGADLSSWESGFEALTPPHAKGVIRFDLSVVHRRAIEVVAADSGPLVWLDLALDFETPACGRSHLFVRFVRDAVAAVWFLHRAASAWMTGANPDRQLVL